ncbi:hypothetical protein ACQZ4Y_16220 [Rhizobium sp. L80/93]|uniref:hypothetical protein n=1 Tax=unclassified Rhizobium TaxID=2613769 RepID=UPI001ADA62F5|nr:MULTISPECIES: hypothetical protein [unclassified Rhizobium]MBO9097123.1 hypothetical protein [Rhizobium sp. L58/93]MBO9167361.1 hypothetical protein [Rhizobium sp. L245/93]MBO9183320.1 hypothetical protein [Rhizobium sp. E27B/91]QXZ83661.1 hypothetical protein J5287_16730 [Rhizobium sp. K1/93]QXZ88827.1 hypothetical protein J5280_11860 [Rhizobium sp. K15/93]
MVSISSRNNYQTDTTRSDLEKARICAANNADLYQAMFRSHGLADQRTTAFWSSDAVAPPYYSNMTTLEPHSTEEQLFEIARLTERLGRRPGLKDGFSRLDLVRRGFKMLFSASWIWAEPHDLPADIPHGWGRIGDGAALARWEQSWKESGSPTDANVFTPALLLDPDIHIYGRLAGGGFDAGCIVNQSPKSVGVSNIFSLNGTPDAFRDAVSLAATAFSGNAPLVGYDSGDALGEMTKLGFRAVGELRVWLPDESA